MYVSLNSNIKQTDETLIPAFHSGLSYGTGCFETIRAESGRLFFFDEHWRRLKLGLLYLGAKESDIPDRKKLGDISAELLKKNELTDAVAKVRILCMLAEKNSYEWDSSGELFTMISAEEYHQKNHPKRLIVAKTRVIPGSCRPVHLKLCNMLHYRNAYREARAKNADDAVMLTVNGLVSESAISNLFWKKGDTFFTPSEQCDLLPGITRKYIIESIKNLTGQKMIAGEFSIGDLMRADSVWVTNSMMEMQQVEQIDDQIFIPDREMTNSIMRSYQSFKTAL